MARHIIRGNSQGEWRVILVRDEAGVDRLNALFDQGWFLEPIDLPGLPYLIFPVTHDDLGEPSRCDRPANTRRRTDPLVLVLTRTGRRQRQRGLVLRPDERGYVDLGVLKDQVKEEGGMARVDTIFGMEDGGCLAIVEWR